MYVYLFYILIRLMLLRLCSQHYFILVMNSVTIIIIIITIIIIIIIIIVTIIIIIIIMSSTIPESFAERIPGQHTQRSAEGVTLMTVLNLSCVMLCSFSSFNSSISIICFVTVSVHFMLFP